MNEWIISFVWSVKIQEHCLLKCEIYVIIIILQESLSLFKGVFEVWDHVWYFIWMRLKIFLLKNSPIHMGLWD